MYALIENGAVKRYPYTATDLRRDNPGTSFPPKPSDAALLQWNVHPVHYAPAPDFDPVTHKLVEQIPTFDGSAWIQQWSVEALSQAEASERNAAKAAEVRSERNAKLAASDWTQVADAPTDKAAWATYRQALRDISAQPGFPWTVTWPTEP